MNRNFTATQLAAKVEVGLRNLYLPVLLIGVGQDVNHLIDIIEYMGRLDFLWHGTSNPP